MNDRMTWYAPQQPRCFCPASRNQKTAFRFIANLLQSTIKSSNSRTMTGRKYCGARGDGESEKRSCRTFEYYVWPPLDAAPWASLPFYERPGMRKNTNPSMASSGLTESQHVHAILSFHSGSFCDDAEVYLILFTLCHLSREEGVPPVP